MTGPDATQLTSGVMVIRWASQDKFTFDDDLICMHLLDTHVNTNEFATNFKKFIFRDTENIFALQGTDPKWDNTKVTVKLDGTNTMALGSMTNDKFDRWFIDLPTV